jgi:hypothetical protein
MMAAPARSTRRRYRRIHLADLWNEAVGDVRFWLTFGVGWLAFFFLVTDTSISVAYLTNYSTLSDKGAFLKVIGAFLAVCVGYFAHIGIHKAWTKLPGRILKVVGVVASLGVVAISYWFAISFFEATWQSDLQKEAELTARAGGLRDVAIVERSTDVEQAAADRALQALTDATRRRGEAENLRAELALLPSGTYHARVAEVQSVIGATPDGVKYNLTTEAMQDFADQARVDEQNADAAYQTALAALTAKQAMIGGAVDKELTAAVIDTQQTYLRSMRSRAEDTLEISYVPDPQTEEDIANNALIQARSEVYANWTGQAISGLVTILSCMLGLFRFQIKDPPPMMTEDDEPEIVEIDGAVQNVRKLLPKGGSAGAEARYVDDGHIADDAPYNPGRETAEAAETRLQRAMARLQNIRKGKAYAGTTDEKAALIEAIADAEERKQEQAEMDALRRQLAEAQAEARRAASTPSVGAGQSAASSEARDLLRSISDRMNARDAQRAEQPLSPRPEPEITKNGSGGAHDTFDAQRRLDELKAEYRQIDAEYDRLLRVVNQHPGSPEAIRAQTHMDKVLEKRLYEIASMLEPLIAAVNRQPVS